MFREMILTRKHTNRDDGFQAYITKNYNHDKVYFS
jgi:hypothetical protein